MRLSRLRQCAFAIATALLAQLAATATAAEKRVALVIGNARYESAPLRNPVNDAKDMAAALRRLGFDVIERTDATQKEMNRAIAQFGGKLTGDAVALFYYAGHGIQVKGKNYLVPVDAQIDTESSVRVETVDVDGVLDQLNASPLNIVILDACRNNPFERRFRGSSGGLAQMDAPKGSLIAYATAPGRTAADGEGRNGTYTRELLGLMQTPGLPIEQIFKRVRSSVARATGDSQIPWEASSLTGDFFFIPAADGTAGAEPAVTQPSPQLPRGPDPAAIELTYWESIKNSSDVADFAAYLKKYPDGQFADLAKNRVAVAASATAEKKRAEEVKDPIVGRWKWFINGIVVFAANGTQLQLETGAKGTWRLANPVRRKYRVMWEAGWVDDLYLSEDGQKLEGSNQFFFPVSAERMGQ